MVLVLGVGVRLRKGGRNERRDGISRISFRGGAMGGRGRGGGMVGIWEERGERGERGKRGRNGVCALVGLWCDTWERDACSLACVYKRWI